MLDQISNDKLKSIYSKFSFKYLNYIFALEDSDENQIRNLLFDYLKKFKFIIYYILKDNSVICQSNNANVQNSDKEEAGKIDIIFCVEYHCIIIEKIEIPIIKKIISHLKGNGSLIINVSLIRIVEEKEIKQELESKEEINYFCQNFSSVIRNNEFVKKTIHPIAGYLIRRYFCPSEYFTDKSFFYFDDTERTEEQKLRKEFNDFFRLPQTNQTEYNLKNKRDLIDFNKKDFYILRTIVSNPKATYCLSLHIESLHIFLMKIFSDFEKTKRERDHEKKFCEHFSHRCLTRCYGFVKEKNQITGIIYKFMSNGSLYSNVLSNQEKIDETFYILTISRIIQGLDYLHTNKCIHRDIKADNILLDHDFLPYISDFDSIRSLNEGEESIASKEMTNDVGAMAYISPEQLRGENVSYASDIYSFGCVIYFMYEKKNLYKKKENVIPKLTQASEIIQTIFSNCLKFDAEKRITSQELKYISSNKIFPMLYRHFNKDYIEPKSLQLIFESFIIFNQFVPIKEKSITLLLLLKGCDLSIIIGSLYEEKQDYNKAKQYYELSAQQNNSDAFNNLGDLYYNGYGVEQDYNKAKEYYELSAQQNNSDAFNNLGLLYEYGYGVEQDYNKAKQYYELSAQQNNSDAFNNLGDLYYNGYGVEQDYNKAKEYYELSSKQNNPNAFNNLGLLYENGSGVEQDYNKAKEYYELSAQQNNSDAFNNLGDLYYNGYGVEQDYNKAKEYYELSAQQNNSDAFNNLGDLYYNGYGVEQDYNKAKEYYELSSKQNNPNAFNNLGLLYYNGSGVEQDYNKAKEYYELSAQQNNSDAFKYLGDLYYNGSGVKQDYNKAKEYYELSAQQNNSDAFNNLGLLYEYGYGVEQDYNKAKEYFELSAQQNNSDAFINLGTLYYNGSGVKQDYHKAKEYFESSIKDDNILAYANMGNLYRKLKDYLLSMKYYKLAAQNNNSEALYKIGNLYLKGRDVEKSYIKAKDFYEQSAKMNNSKALFKLGKLYYNGQGVCTNYRKAKEYYELSGRQGNSKALFEIGTLYFEGQRDEQNYDKAKNYYEMSVYNNNPDGLFFLGVFYSRGDILKVKIQLAVQYFLKSIEIHYDQVRVYNIVDKCYYIKSIYNNYFYHSHNDLGLIYLTIYEDIENATKYIKEAAFGEYPFGQNNFGLLNEIYLNKLGNAEYMYQRSSKHNFALAFYNLGHLKEKEMQKKSEEKKERENQESEEYIECYKNASDNENYPLIFHNRQYYDKQLEISKTFIICMTNLKLCKFYFSKGKFEESKKYFTRSFSKLLNNSEHSTFQIKIEEEDTETFFSNLKIFILRFPLFNLCNQTNLTLKKGTGNDVNSKQDQMSSSRTKEKIQGENTEGIKKKIKERKYLENKGIKKEIVINIKEEQVCKCVNDNINSREEEEIKVFKDGNEIFEFIVSSEKYKNIFEEEINKIIQVMYDIIYTPPYPILFGRISISKNAHKEVIFPFQKEINELFYEGLGFDEFKYTPII